LLKFTSKLILSVIISLLAYSGVYAQSWNIETTGTSSFLYSVDFADAQTGWAAGENGVIIKSTDG